MARVIVLQRVVPHYRVPIYRRLADELGWEIVYGRNAASENLAVVDDAPFLHPIDYKRWSKRGSTRYVVPIRHILEKFEPDAIVAEGAPGMTSTWELGARRLLGGTMLLFWSVGYDPNNGAGPLQWPYILAYAPADAMILYGREGAEFLRRFYPNKPMFVASNTIDVEELRRYRDHARPTPRLGRPELVTVSRLTPNKNIVGLVKSFLEFRRQFPDAALKILGEGPDRPNIEAAAGDQLGKSVVLVGASYDEAETARHLVAADLCVMAGRVGLSINHALAYDIPFVAFSRWPDGPHHGAEFNYLIDGRTGFIVQEGTTEGLTRKLAEIFATGRDWKSELRPGIRDFVRQHLVPDRMLDGFRAADAFITRRKNHAN